ncbi:MAG: HdeD family acid-resistance protein [Methylovirgula sp.]
MTLNPSLDGLQERVATALKRHTTYFLVEGIVLIILGFAAIAVPFIATLTFTIFFGWLLLISGVVGLVSTFSLRPAAGFWWSLLSAILAIAVGFLLIARPGQGAVSLTLLLIIFFIIEGFSSIIFATEYRQNSPAAGADGRERRRRSPPCRDDFPAIAEFGNLGDRPCCLASTWSLAARHWSCSPSTQRRCCRPPNGRTIKRWDF